MKNIGISKNNELIGDLTRFLNSDSGLDTLDGMPSPPYVNNSFLIPHQGYIGEYLPVDNLVPYRLH